MVRAFRRHQLGSSRKARARIRKLRRQTNRLKMQFDLERWVRRPHASEFPDRPTARRLLPTASNAVAAMAICFGSRRCTSSDRRRFVRDDGTPDTPRCDVRRISAFRKGPSFSNFAPQTIRKSQPMAVEYNSRCEFPKPLMRGTSNKHLKRNGRFKRVFKVLNQRLFGTIWPSHRDDVKASGIFQQIITAQIGDS